MTIDKLLSLMTPVQRGEFAALLEDVAVLDWSGETIPTMQQRADRRAIMDIRDSITDDPIADRAWMKECVRRMVQETE